MPYITFSTHRKIISEIDTRSINLEGDIYKGIDFKILNKLEKTFLLATRMFIERPYDFLKINYKKIDRHVDTSTYVEEYTGQAPAYHKNKYCKKFLNSFNNFKIPAQISKSDSVEIERFREWYKREGLRVIGDTDLFIAKLGFEFGIYGLSPADVQNLKVDYSNSSNSNPKGIMEMEIKNQILEINEFISRSEMHRSIMAKYLKNSYLYKEKEGLCVEGKEYTHIEIQKVLEDFEKNLKLILIEKLNKYYYLNSDKELEFEARFLDSLGILKCRECYRN